MTTWSPARGLAPELVDDLSAHAGSLDAGRGTSRRAFGALGAAGLLGIGAPGNVDGRLPEMASVVREIAGVCMSTAFSVWAHRMAVEYLAAADTAYATGAVESLLAGARLGVTGMAAAFKEAAGCGSLDLAATPTDGGYELSGVLRWASNVHPDSLLVTAAGTEAGEKLIVALPLAASGVTAGKPFDLLALGSTASSSVRLDAVRVPNEQVLSTDLTGFLAMVRPTFLVLQSAMCLGLARVSAEQARLGLSGVNAVFADEFGRAEADLAHAESTLTDLAEAVGSARPPTSRDLLSLRLSAAELAVTCTGLEIRTAGGKGYASNSAANRRFREATFLPVQSPSEAQLRWELAACT
ncbi:MAG TPA: acyl-CoA dehydrogenase family protein [Amycolatopsis sp.]|nr:acyl-CoA dehydrogenase family protein [Amycolatopsis sp.]